VVGDRDRGEGGREGPRDSHPHDSHRPDTRRDGPRRH
jgi:hypothetical protein